MANRYSFWAAYSHDFTKIIEQIFAHPASASSMQPWGSSTYRTGPCSTICGVRCTSNILNPWKTPVMGAGFPVAPICSHTPSPSACANCVGRWIRATLV